MSTDLSSFEHPSVLLFCLADSNDTTVKISSFICLFNFLEVVHFRTPFHIQQNKQTDLMFHIPILTLMDRIYPKALADIKIEGVI